MLTTLRAACQFLHLRVVTLRATCLFLTQCKAEYKTHVRFESGDESPHSKVTARPYRHWAHGLTRKLQRGRPALRTLCLLLLQCKAEYKTHVRLESGDKSPHSKVAPRITGIAPTDFHGLARKARKLQREPPGLSGPPPVLHRAGCWNPTSHWGNPAAGRDSASIPAGYAKPPLSSDHCPA